MKLVKMTTTTTTKNGVKLIFKNVIRYICKYVYMFTSMKS